MSGDFTVEQRMVRPLYLPLSFSVQVPATENLLCATAWNRFFSLIFCNHCRTWWHKILSEGLKETSEQNRIRTLNAAFVITPLLTMRLSGIMVINRAVGEDRKVLGDCCPPLPSLSLIILQTACVESAEEKSQLTRGIAKQQLMKRIQTMATKHCRPSNSFISFTRVRGGLCQQQMS